MYVILSNNIVPHIPYFAMFSTGCRVNLAKVMSNSIITTSYTESIYHVGIKIYMPYIFITHNYIQTVWIGNKWNKMRLRFFYLPSEKSDHHMHKMSAISWSTVDGATTKSSITRFKMAAPGALVNKKRREFMNMPAPLGYVPGLGRGVSAEILTS